MKRLVFYIICFLNLNLAYAQLFLEDRPLIFGGIVLNTDPGKPFEFRMSRIKPSAFGSFQMKLAPGYKLQEVTTTTFSRDYIFKDLGEVKTSKMIRFLFLEFGVLSPLSESNFRRSFLAFNLPMGFSNIKTAYQYTDDPLFGNQLILEPKPDLYLNFSIELEYLYAFNILNKATIETGISFTLPINSYRLFPEVESNNKTSNYIPGAGFFPYFNLSCSYNFLLR
jgi:hypothetical protein